MFPHHLDSFIIAVHTGMRLSEQFTLEWEQVNLERRSIHLTKTKNGSERHIPLNSTALAAFKRLRTTAPKGTPSIFLTLRKDADGHPVRIRTPRTWFEDVIEASGFQDMTWHTLRHTFISRLVMAGVDLRTVMELAGHKSMVMTLRYSHLAPEHTAAAIERIAKPVEKPTAKPKRNQNHSRKV